MLVLGVTDGITCGAAVVEDGIIIAAVNEERLCRKKMAYGFPRQSIAEVMRLSGIRAGDIDAVAVDTVNNFFFDGVREFDGWLQQDRGFVRNSIFSLAGRLSFLAGVIPGVEGLYYIARSPIFSKRRKRIGHILKNEFNLSAPVRFVDHHLAHAASAYFTSGFDDAAVISMDGGGDGMSSRIYLVRDGNFSEVGSTTAFDSLANYYAYVTHICGYKAQKHEGKITGLAAHGQPVYVDLLNSMITFQDGRIRNVGGRVFRGAIEDIKKRLGESWEKQDLAASIQHHCEQIAVDYIRHHVPPENRKNVAIAGGLFANVRINQMVYEMEGVERIFVHPGMTDAGLAVGAALSFCIKNNEGPVMPRNPEVIRDVYFGPDYSSHEIEREIGKAGLKYSKPGSMEKEIASLLAKGHVVARFDGRMEYGPRALGNRSILYQPADHSVNDWLNKCLHRTEFMPFAPSTNIEHTGDYFRNYEGAKETARFMTITFDCTKQMKETCPGVVHVDGTARPQLVVKDDNPSYYRIIEEFGKLTGVFTIINTSFNMHEEPIVCSPGDAIRAFRMGHLDYLAIGEFMVPSPEPIKHVLKEMSKAAQDMRATVSAGSAK